MMRLSKVEKRTLTALAGMGPCSNKALADALGWPPAEVYKIVYRLRQKGVAKYGYDATETGREIVRRAIASPGLFQMQMLEGGEINGLQRNNRPLHVVWRADC